MTALDRLLILHADDIGMCHSANAASFQAMTEGVVSSGSVMVPCPWFPEAAAWAKAHPEADLGVHLTLTSEWQLYRWRPVAPQDRVRGLLDSEGFLWRSVAEVREHASAAEVETELRAQVERALQFGMRPTHLDSHMGTLFLDRRFFEAYLRVSREFGIMPLLMKPSAEQVGRLGSEGEDLLRRLQALEDEGFVLVDRLITGLEGQTLQERSAYFHRLLRTLPPGVSQIIVHLAGDDDEIRHITHAWRDRYHELLICTADETKAVLAEEGIRLIGYRDLRAGQR